MLRNQPHTLSNQLPCSSSKADRLFDFDTITCTELQRLITVQDIAIFYITLHQLHLLDPARSYIRPKYSRGITAGSSPRHEHSDVAHRVGWVGALQSAVQAWERGVRQQERQQEQHDCQQGLNQ
jgi:hypothetical protein